MEKQKHFLRIFALAALFLMAGYLISLHTAKTEKNNVIISTKTGKPMTQKEIDAVLKRQKEERKVYGFSGNVIAKQTDFLQVEVSLGEVSRLLELRFSPDMVFHAEAPSLKNPSVAEEKEISLDEIKIGDRIAIIVSKGILETELDGTKPVEVSNLIVHMPRTGIEKD